MSLTTDRIILIACILFSTFLLIYTTPWSKIREALQIFMFKQTLTWPLGILVVNQGWLQYPVREFPHVIKNSFSFEYYIYPAICVVFVLHYPAYKPVIYRIGWYLFFPTWMTIIEVLIEHHSRLILYVTWSWYWTWITLLVTFYIARKQYEWYTMKET